MRNPCRRAARPMISRIKISWSAAATGGCGASESSNWLAPYSGCSCSIAMPARVAEPITSRTNASCSSTPARPYCAHNVDGNRCPSGATRTNSTSCPMAASMPASASAASTRFSVPRAQLGMGVPSWAKNAAGAQARPSPTMRNADRSIRRRWSPTTPTSAVNAMPVWSTAKACQDGLAPRPGSAKVFVRRIGTVLARVSPAGLTTVPITVSTPSASSWAIAAAASGVPVMAVIVQGRGPGARDFSSGGRPTR
ncbi:hypothetical protein PICSAR65_04622 [Mycobacterium avium subsp. paratuberculosis]|nr:hypothetical protein PICSAR65_04622 [Mycobacterium avium subsp. paratuberculosis]